MQAKMILITAAKLANKYYHINILALRAYKEIVTEPYLSGLSG